MSIGHVGFDQADIRRFCDLEGVRQLKSLRLCHYHIEDDAVDDAVRELVARPSFPHLRTLDLSHNRTLTDEGLRAIAGSPHLGELRTLDLYVCRRLTDAGLRALAASPHFPHLAYLDLRATGATATGVRALYSPNLPRLGRIDLSYAEDGWGTLPVGRPPDPSDQYSGVLWVRDVRAEARPRPKRGGK